MLEKDSYWDILENLPIGWIIDNTAGSPIKNTVFITNGKSVFNGQKRALLRVKSEIKQTQAHTETKPNKEKEVINSFDLSNKNNKNQVQGSLF